MRPPSTLAALLVIGYLAGCVDDGLAFLQEDDSAVPGEPARITESYVQGETQVDLLFVIDNSAGMGPIQAALTGQIDQLLDRFSIARVDWRIGVITSDLGIEPFTGPGCALAGGDGGVLQNAPRLFGCEAPEQRYISGTNVADPAAAFACIARVGTDGCGFEQPMAAALKALDPQRLPAENAGFLRDTAQLMVVFVSNEDDCSAAEPRIYDPDDLAMGEWTSHRCFAHGVTCTGSAADGSLTGCASAEQGLLLPIAEVAMQLRSIKARGSVVVVAAVGPPEPVTIINSAEGPKLSPSCSSADLHAVPGIRFAELVDRFGADGELVPVCGADLGASLAKAVGRLRSTSGPHCLLHPLRDPARPGCAVQVTLPSGMVRQIPPSLEGAPGFRLVHPLLPGCEHGAVDFDDLARPPAGSTVAISCDFAQTEGR